MATNGRATEKTTDGRWMGGGTGRAARTDRQAANECIGALWWLYKGSIRENIGRFVGIVHIMIGISRLTHGLNWQINILKWL